MTWDKYYLDICNVIATNSKCHSRQIGAILVKDKSIIATGYNGPPRGVPDCKLRGLYDQAFLDEIKSIEENKQIFFEEKTIGFIKTKEMVDKPRYIWMGCPRHALGYKSGEGLEWCVAGHAERNALINAARHGVCVKGATMYMNCGIPCKDCLIEIINAGVAEIVCKEDKYYDSVSEYLIRMSGVKIRKLNGDWQYY
jgi:dCMP deaminase